MVTGDGGCILMGWQRKWNLAPLADRCHRQRKFKSMPYKCVPYKEGGISTGRVTHMESHFFRLMHRWA